jgi:release factor glutamine methyltransferase
LISLLEVLERTDAFLKKKGSASPRLDGELLLGHVLSLSRLDVYMNFERPMMDKELDALRPLVKRRGEREPIATILGEKEFWSLPFACAAGVLVPRPDTETLVEAAIPFCEGETFLADVGAGTGCVGLSIAKECGGVKLFATDLSPEALALVKQNAEALEIKARVACLRGNLLEPIPAKRRVDVVVSNPPYIPSADIDALEPEVAVHEPRLALDGGADGLDCYRVLIPAAFARAERALLVEVGAGQAEDVAVLFRDSGFVDVQTHKDLAGIERVVSGRKEDETLSANLNNDSE